MKVAFVIRRLSTYKLVGPIIEQALRSGAAVDCWHDHGQPSDGLKGYLFPTVSARPQFASGAPGVQTFRSPDELASGLQSGSYDAVLSIGTRHSDIGDRPLPSSTPWCLLQTGIDTFLTFRPASLLSCDLLLILTPWWLEWADAYYRAVGAGGEQPLPSLLRSRTVLTGFPEVDVRAQIDPLEVRARWGIPKGRPIVLLLPFPGGVGKKTFWPQQVFGEPSRVLQLFNILRGRRFEYLRQVRAGWSDFAVVQAIRGLCDNNGAFLLVKSREKTPIPGYLRSLADKALYDESYYAPTILEALSISALCISYYSLSVLEAAAFGVPNLCITFDAEDYLGEQTEMRAYFDRFFVAKEGSAFQFEGVSTTITIAEAIHDLPSRSLADFAITPSARRGYLDKFVGDVEGSAARAFASIQRAACLP